MESVDLFVNKLLFVTKDPLRSSHDLTKKICRRSPEIDQGRIRKSPRVIELILELDRGKTLFIGFSACET